MENNKEKEQRRYCGKCRDFIIDTYEADEGTCEKTGHIAWSDDEADDCDLFDEYEY